MIRSRISKWVPSAQFPRAPETFVSRWSQVIIAMLMHLQEALKMAKSDLKRQSATSAQSSAGLTSAHEEKVALQAKVEQLQASLKMWKDKEREARVEVEAMLKDEKSSSGAVSLGFSITLDWCCQYGLDYLCPVFDRVSRGPGVNVGIEGSELLLMSTDGQGEEGSPKGTTSGQSGYTTKG